MLKYFFILLNLFQIYGYNIENKKPNVLWIVVDDLGWNDTGFRSHQIKTPTIDHLRNTGVTLDRYYVQMVCSPTRATFMTGRFAIHHGIVDIIRPSAAAGLPKNLTTVADKMQQNGYDTHAIGKWHLGFYKEEYTPTFRGFNSFYGYYEGAEDYFTHKRSGYYDFRRESEPYCGQKNCSKVETDAYDIYSTTLHSWEAKRIIENHDEQKPLFMYLAYQAVHGPAQAPENYTSAYDGIIDDKIRKVFAGMLSCADEGIKNVTDALKQKGLLDNTLIIFTSDNGGPSEPGIGSNNLPLRGEKHTIWEGGTRVTAFVNGPMLKKTNHTFNHLMHGADWFPTLCEAAGINCTDVELDGVSQWQGLVNGNDAPHSRTGLVQGNDSCSITKGNCGFSIIEGDYKLIKGFGGTPDTWCYNTEHGNNCWWPAGDYSNTTNGWMLYDIVKDPNEEFLEISSSHPEKLQEMQQKMGNVLKTYFEVQDDKTCPKPTHTEYPIVGKVVEPWCD